MNDLGEIWLVREADKEQKVIINHSKNYKSRGEKVPLPAWGSEKVL